MIIRNPLIPFPRFLAVNICGLIFTRRNVRLTPVDLNHERIHTRQMVETLFVGFYLWYVVEWLVRLAIVHNGLRAYHAIRFEREAYDHESRAEFTTEGNGGYNYKYVRLSYEHPKFKRIQLSIEDWRSLEKADKLLRDMQDARRDYDYDVQTALFNLRTERNVTDQFPEALPFLNFTACTALAPNLTPLRALLNQNL